MSVLDGPSFTTREWQTALPIVKTMYQDLLQPVSDLTYIKPYVYMDDVILGAHDC